MKIHLLLALIGSVAISTACVHTRAVSPAQSKCNEASALGQSQISKSDYSNDKQLVELLSACLAAPDITNKQKEAAYNIRGHAYSRLGDYTKALSDQEASYQLNPSAKTGWDIITRASAYRDAGQAAYALTLLREMLDQKIGLFGKGTTPGMPSYYHLGRTFLELKQWPEAAESFTEGLTYQPGYAWAYLYRAVAYDALGYQQRATADVCKGMKLIDGESDSNKKQLKQGLEKPPFPKLFAEHPCS